ncbi:hypothetical protein H9Q10_06480 [Eikenella sp. S3360]|uniref:DUF3828 domain-containing protein n=1 Tax=Eikenella glucosivorans TaxID=2766967 RepID=A0ABS0NAJ1_9NEIS|nr:hypothetical protein [Eikenella glucosivorans]MBH5329314.1 hypothetical protein [Eikenella glucosivorans]
MSLLIREMICDWILKGKDMGKWMIIAAQAALLMASAVQAQTLDEQAKIQVVRQAYAKEDYLPYASPEFKRVVNQAYRIIDRVNTRAQGIECEYARHFDMGIGNGGAPDDLMRTLRVTPLQGDRVQATFKDFANPGEPRKTVTTHFNVSCHNGRCQINDVGNVRRVYQQIVRTNRCE